MALPTFSLNEKESAKAEEWLKQHMKTHKFTKRARMGEGRGGRLSYEFTPTGIGVGITVKCACGASCDVTDIDSW